MKRILVTGGAGFIGSNIANTLADKGDYRVVVCDSFGETDKWLNLAKHEIFEIIAPMDIFYWLESNADRVHAIVHMGAVSSTTETDVDMILENNFSLSKLLWNWSAEYGVPFIYASSAATYGDGQAGFKDDLSPEYLTKLAPLNAYGWSKHLFDRFVANVIDKGDHSKPPQWAGLKFFNVYGPNEYHKGSQKSVAAQIFPHAKANRPVKLFKSYNPEYEDGKQERDFVYVKDCVRIVEWLLNNPDVSGLFNVGTGEARTFDDLARATFAAVGKEPAVSYIDMPEGLKLKYQYHTQADMDKLRKAGYQEPFTSLEEGIKDYVQNYLMQDEREHKHYF